MIHLTVPVPLMPAREVDWTEYRNLLKSMKADRVLLFAPMDSIIRKTIDRHGRKLAGRCALSDTPDLAFFELWSAELRKRIAFFKKAGIETGFWLGHSIGHGGALSGRDTNRFQPLVGPEGKEVPGCFCPLDGRFRRYIASALAQMAQSGVGLLVMDDDFRIHRHGSQGPVGCFCPLHLKAFAAGFGKPMSRDAIYRAAFARHPGRVRTAWLETLGSSLMLLASDIEKSVHAVNADARIGLCTAMTLWSNEGVDMRALLSTLAGGTRPFLRTIGAPYWSKEPANIGWIVEYANLQRRWMKGFDAEILTEGDTFPHSRFFCSAEALNAFEAGHVASGHHRSLLYPINYTQPPSRERGFTDRIIASRPYMNALARFFPEDGVSWGIELAQRPNSFLHQVLPKQPDIPLIRWPDLPATLDIMSRLGLPLGFDGRGPVVFAGFGGAGLSDQEIDALLGRGALLDVTAAKWLTKRGFDVGLAAARPQNAPVFEHYADHPFNGAYSGDDVLLVTDGEGLYQRVKTAPGAMDLSRFVSGGGGNAGCASFVYENRRGQRVCLAAFDFHAALNGRQLLYSYARQEQWSRALAWVNRCSLPVVLPGEPEVRVVCRVSGGGDRVSVALQNLRLDPLVNPRMRLHPSILCDSTVRMLLPDTVKPIRPAVLESSRQGNERILCVKATVQAMGLLALSLPLAGHRGRSGPSQRQPWWSDLDCRRRGAVRRRTGAAGFTQ